MDRQTDGQRERLINVKMNRQLDGKWTYRQTVKQTGEQTGRWIGGLMDRQTDGQTDGQADKQLYIVRKIYDCMKSGTPLVNVTLMFINVRLAWKKCVTFEKHN